MIHVYHMHGGGRSSWRAVSEVLNPMSLSAPSPVGEVLHRPAADEQVHTRETKISTTMPRFMQLTLPQKAQPLSMLHTAASDTSNSRSSCPVTHSSSRRTSSCIPSSSLMQR